MFYECLSIASNFQNPFIKISIKNSSLLPKKITIITYQPGEAGNGTEQVVMLPKSKKVFNYKRRDEDLYSRLKTSKYGYERKEN